MTGESNFFVMHCDSVSCSYNVFRLLHLGKVGFHQSTWKQTFPFSFNFFPLYVCACSLCRKDIKCFVDRFCAFEDMCLKDSSSV